MIGEFDILFLGFQSRINQLKNTEKIFTLSEKIFYHAPPLIARVLWNFCVTITGQVNKMNPVIDEEIIDGLRFSGRSWNVHEVFAAAEHVDERWFPNIWSSNKGKLRFAVGWTFYYINITSSIISWYYFHKNLTAASAKCLQRKAKKYSNNSQCLPLSKYEAEGCSI